MKRRTTIPVVDLADLGIDNEGDVLQSTWKRVANELDDALTNIGFVYLKNHGISPSTIGNVYEVSGRFFQSTPATAKCQHNVFDNTKYLHDMKSRRNGYLGSGLEILESKNRHEVREAFDVTSIDGFFPDGHLPEFRSAVAQLLPQLCKLSNRLLTCLAIGLGLAEDFFTERHRMMCHGSDKNSTTFRTLFYPALDASYPSASAALAGIERCGQHSDYGTFTLLFQDDIGGLEVLSGDEWIPAVPIPGAVLVNVGDLMQFWTSDRYPATIHRVRVPEEELRRRQPRQSLAFFVHPDNDVIVTPLIQNGVHSIRRAPISALAHLNLRYSQTYKY